MNWPIFLNASKCVYITVTNMKTPLSLPLRYQQCALENRRWIQVPRRQTAYKILMDPLMEYAYEIWDPHTTQDVPKLARVQRLALHSIYSKYRRLDFPTATYSEANLPVLKTRRKEKRFKLLYTILNDFQNIDKTAYVIFDVSRITRNKHSHTIRQPQCFKDYFKYSFSP